jgi:hypothetical protein
MAENNSEADDVKNDDTAGRATSPSRRRALATLASVPVLVTIKARSAYAVSNQPSQTGSSTSRTQPHTAPWTKKK